MVLKNYKKTLTSLINFHSSLNAIISQNNINDDIVYISLHYIPSVGTVLKKMIKCSRMYIYSEESSSVYIAHIIQNYLKPIVHQTNTILNLLYKFNQHLNKTENYKIQTRDHHLMYTIDFYNNILSSIHEIIQIYTEQVMRTVCYKKNEN
jgi:hypothetical protein